MESAHLWASACKDSEMVRYNCRGERKYNREPRRERNWLFILFPVFLTLLKRQCIPKDLVSYYGAVSMLLCRSVKSMQLQGSNGVSNLCQPDQNVFCISWNRHNVLPLWFSHIATLTCHNEQKRYQTQSFLSLLYLYYLRTYDKTSLSFVSCIIILCSLYTTYSIYYCTFLCSSKNLEILELLRNGL